VYNVERIHLRIEYRPEVLKREYSQGIASNGDNTFRAQLTREGVSKLLRRGVSKFSGTMSV
jgi:hypothetical protein